MRPCLEGHQPLDGPECDKAAGPAEVLDMKDREQLAETLCNMNTDYKVISGSWTSAAFVCLCVFVSCR